LCVPTGPMRLLGSAGAPDVLSAVEYRPADVVPQPLVVEYELANRLRELVALPPALASPCALALSFRRGSTCGLDRIGGRTELVRGDVCDDRRLAGSVRGMACCPTQVSGRGRCMAARRASLGGLPRSAPKPHLSPDSPRGRGSDGSVTGVTAPVGIPLGIRSVNDA
jgi:hypothetical protein